MTNIERRKVVIIGAGPAGYTAAIYAARACLDPVMITGLEKGGQLMNTTDVENYPGYEHVIQGPWLMEQMEKQVMNLGVEMVNEYVSEVDFSQNNGGSVVYVGDQLSYRADTVIVATGATTKWLNIESEEKFKGYGVSSCATCDGFFYKNKVVLVVGGGDTAAEEALYLTNHASKVILIHRRDNLRAGKILQQRLFAHPKIEVMWNKQLDEVLGEEKPKFVTGCRLRDTIDGEMQEVKCDGVFIAIGHSPATELFRGKLDLDESGYIITEGKSTRTSVPGVFAAGDVQDHTFRQAVTAAGTGCMAALEAERFISGVLL